MSCSKPLPPFTYDVLRYLNRNQLERFSIVCCALKNFVDRYFNSKPYRIFDRMKICGGSYALFHNDVQWHPNQENYSAQQFFAGQKCSLGESKIRVNNWDDHTYYSFVEMRPYFGPTVRVKRAIICVGEDSIYDPDQIEQMESIAYLWREGNIHITNTKNYDPRKLLAEDFQLILNSSTILQCRILEMPTAHFSFKDYNVLYTVKVIETFNGNPTLWQQFLENPGIKPVIAFPIIHPKHIDGLLNQLSKTFSSAVSPNAFKIVFVRLEKPLTEFRETNNTSREKLELKKGLPAEYQIKYWEKYNNYTLERSVI